MNIIVKGKTTEKFYPHYNRSLGTFVHTKEDYLKEMKKGGFVPYEKDKDYEPKLQKARISEDTRHMVAHIKANTDKEGRFRPSTAFVDALEKKKKGLGKNLINPGKYKAQDEQMKKGGFF
jgi:hypothetical protein